MKGDKNNHHHHRACFVNLVTWQYAIGLHDTLSSLNNLFQINRKVDDVPPAFFFFFFTFLIQYHSKRTCSKPLALFSQADIWTEYPMFSESSTCGSTTWHRKEWLKKKKSANLNENIFSLDFLWQLFFCLSRKKKGNIHTFQLKHFI